MITPAHVVIETVKYVTPFGLALWDMAAGRIESEGIRVRVHRVAGTRVFGAITATPTYSGIFGAHGIPGLTAYEAGTRREDAWVTSPPTAVYLVEVRDALDRFTPFVVHVNLPSRGLTAAACADALWPADAMSSPPTSPQEAPPYVPLFSTPARLVRAGMAVVRATLVDADTGLPAEFAVLEVRESGRLLARGIAAKTGEVAAMFSYPEPAALPPVSSPVDPPAQPVPLIDQAWALDIAVRYRRALPRYATDPDQPPLADLCDIVQQPFATVMTTSPPATLAAATLRYGRELVLGADAGAELLIRPA